MSINKLIMHKGGYPDKLSILLLAPAGVAAIYLATLFIQFPNKGQEKVYIFE